MENWEVKVKPKTIATLSLIIGLSSCYNYPTKKNNESCKEWRIGERYRLVCTYSNKSIMEYSSNGKVTSIVRAIDTNGDGIYDKIISNHIILSPGKIKIDPKIKKKILKKRGTYL